MPTQNSNDRLAPLLKALLAALLFGASAPLAKALLQDVQPIALAALLYFGCGVGALLFRLVQRMTNSQEPEARLVTKDLPWLAGATFAGGVAAPIILMFSLKTTPAGTASLLLNFEGVATALVAGLVFREAIGRHAWSAIALVTLGGILLSWSPTGWGFSVGALGVMAACSLWGIDNNLTRHISGKNPVTIVAAKGLVAGTVSLALAIAFRQPLPAFGPAALAMLLGSVSYGLSIVLFVMALRDLGAARTGALYATAPFLGMALSIVMFRERPGLAFLLAIPLMIAGAFFLLRENHQHHHEHAPVEHEHNHNHRDGHHLHQHSPAEAPGNGSHCHPHPHDAVAHRHEHTPDLHHRHEHQAGGA